jgi:DNA end-binding protein Ku
VSTSEKKGAAPSRGTKLSLSVGLVNVPVKVATFTKDRAVRGTTLCPDHLVPVKSGKGLCSGDGHVVEESITGFEHEGRYVTGVNRADHYPKGDGVVRLENVVEMGAIDPVRFEKTYLIWPQEGGEPAYDLLAATLRANGKALIGRTVLTTSTRALAIRWSEETGTLVGHVLTYDASIGWSDVKLVADAMAERPVVDQAQMDLAETLIGSLSADLDLSAVEDDYNAALEAAIEAAAKGQPAPVLTAVPEAPATGDLMAALEASVAATAKAKAKGRKKVAA